MAAGRASYRFDRFELDLDRMVLFESGRPVELRPKAFDTLLALVKRAGQVVTKDELVATVWPDVIVNDDALAQCVRDIRKALGHDAQDIVRTVPRRGYIFAVPVERTAPALESVPARRPVRPALAGLIALCVLLSGAAGLWLWAGRGSPESTPVFARDARMMVAVLPFDAGGEVDETAWLGEGLADDIMFALSRFRDIAVIARNSSFRYRDADLAAIRNELGADFLVQGSVRRAGDQLRLAVQLVDLSTGVNRWTERFERPYADLPTLQDAIASELAVALAARARDAVAERPPGTDTRMLAAYELALKARKALLSFDREKAFEALEFAQQAVEADPSYAVAWELLAQIHLQFFIQPYDERRGDPATLAHAREAAARAVSLDPAYSTAQATLAGLVARENDYDGALDMLRRALALNPNDAAAMSTYGDTLARAGDHAGSLAAWGALEQLDPVGTPLALALKARAQVFTGDAVGGLTTARTCAARAGQFQPCLVILAMAAAAAGEEALAKETGSRLLAVNPRFTIDRHFQLVPFRRREDVNFMTDSLLRAGLPQ